MNFDTTVRIIPNENHIVVNDHLIISLELIVRKLLNKLKTHFEETL